MADQERHCGYAAIIGAPNAGKSTLVNALVGAKVSIVTPKVQTTRMRVLGIAIKDALQLVLLDTPGIFTPKRRLDRAMVDAAWQGAGDADVVVFLHDASKRSLDEDSQSIAQTLASVKKPTFLVLNKVDRAKHEVLLERAARLNEIFPFDRTFMISALTGSGVSDLLTALFKKLPKGPWLYEEDQLTDMPLRLWAAELTREQLFLKLHEELPYSLTVETEKWEDFKDGSVKISQIVYVERPSQKAIVLGKEGAQIRTSRMRAQAEIQKALDRRVHLFITVKVRENWQDDPERYRSWGLNFEG